MGDKNRKACSEEKIYKNVIKYAAKEQVKNG